MISYDSIFFCYEKFSAMTEVKNFDISLLHLLPLNHIASYSLGMLLSLHAIQFQMISKLDASTIVKAVNVYNPSLILLVPSMFDVFKQKALAEINKSKVSSIYYTIATGIIRFFRKNFGLRLTFLGKPIYKKLFGNHIKILAGGGSVFNEDTIKFYEDLGLLIFNVYGSTECGALISGFHAKYKYHTKGVGKYNEFPDVDIILKNKDEQGFGEVCVKSPSLMIGYLNDAELTANVYDENGYFLTGDRGFIDNEDNLVICGRIKENIVLKTGEKITPDEVEIFYSKYTDKPFAVTGVPVAGNLYDEVHVFIENNSSSKEVENILSSMSVKAPKNYRIHKIHIIDAIPKTQIGKTKRFTLKEYALNNSFDKVQIDTLGMSDVEKKIILNLAEKRPNIKIEKTMNIQSDLGFDSLEIFEMISSAENEFKIDLINHIENLKTIEDLIKTIESLI